MNMRIALADDELDSRRMLARMLVALGYDVCYSAEDGEELLQFDLEQQVDVVILDLDMPNLDGLATAEEVSRRGIPVILLSGHADLDSVVVEKEPVLLKLSKPVEASPLQDALLLAAERRR
ncbi:response regulator [Aeoliella sp. ICT_H6.2]|uniref:Response regulator n=1 Tax=Aeoliella straminimaris TaxID=2954799 RepID=A0A9X2JH36_9BACT|nr:response regulator [Aeoliella straminimaris]MCO6045057.1 response regulator [Aeoliella straminimaris]